MLIKMNLRKAIVLLGILFFWSGQAVPQNRVVVIPLGSDVSAKQFNDLLNQVNRTQVLSGFVDSNGDGIGNFSSTRLEEGVYEVTLAIPQVDNFFLFSPNIVVSSKDVPRIPAIAILESHGAGETIRFQVTLRAFDGNIADASFFFHVQFTSTIENPASDLRLKTNVDKLTVTTDGLNVYKFNYINDTSKTNYIGVMAQELLATNPHAVSKAEDGYYRVDYFKLGLRMATLEHWDKLGLSAVQMNYGI